MRSYQILAAASMTAVLIGGASASAQNVWDQMAEGGAITIENIRRNAYTTFDNLDRNSDGVITEREFLTRDLPQGTGPDGPDRAARAELFSLLEEDGDGVIDEQEWHSALEKNVSLADADGDGAVTLEELAEVDAGTVVQNFLGF